MTAVGTGDGSSTGSKAPEACLAAHYGSSDEVIVPVVQLSVSVADRASFDPVDDSSAASSSANWPSHHRRVHQ